MNVIDAPVREQAVAGRGANQLVEAGAGTGKTTLLVQRALSRLESGTPIDRLALITFTRKAAAELSARLRSALTERRDQGEAWAATALDRFDLASLGTTDSFCFRLLSDFALEAGCPPGFTLADELTASSLRDESWRHHVATDSRTENLLSQLRRSGVSIPALRQLGEAMISQRDLELRTHASPVRASITSVVERAQRELELLRGSCSNPSDRLARHLDRVLRLIRVATTAGDSAGSRALLESRGSGFARKIGAAGSWGGKAGKERVLRSLQKLDDEIDKAALARGHSLAHDVASWLTGFVNEYARRKRAAGLVDFRDLALLLRDLLVRDERTRRRIQERFDEILMDEVQDTDPLQLEVAFLLAASTVHPEDPILSPLEPGRLFLVGDPKQSIYRFRRADIELFARARRRLSSSGHISVIRQNFRCDPAIVEFVNTTFQGWMDAGGEDYQAEYEALEPGRDEGENSGVSLLTPDPDVIRRLEETPDLASSDRRREGELDAVVRLIRRILGEGGERWRVRDPGTGEERPVRALDVAILVRKIEWGDSLHERLRADGIPSTVSGGKRFYQREEIETCAITLSAIVRPEDSLARFAALRSAAFGIPDDELALYFLNEPASRALHEANQALERWSERARALPVGDFLLEWMEELSLLANFGWRPDGNHRVESIRSLIHTLTEVAEEGFDTLLDVVRWLEEQRENPGAEGVEEAVTGDEEGVQILTMHKSKGLEFPIVVLADLAGEPRTAARIVPDRNRGLLEFSLSETQRIESPGFADAHEAERTRRLAEDVRLLYVAMTRARERLVLSWPESKRGFLAANSLPSRIDCAPGAPPPEDSGLDHIDAGSLPPLGSTRRLFDLDLPQDTSRAPESPRVPSHDDRIATASAPRKRIVPVSELLSEGHVDSSTGAETDGVSAASSSAPLGTWVHRVLERFSPESGLEVAIREVTRATPTEEMPTEEVLGKARALLERVALDPALQEIWEAPRSSREVPFSLPVGRLILVGTLDVIYESPSGEIVIVDYKTGRVDGSSHARIRRQAALYALAANSLFPSRVGRVEILALGANPVEKVRFLADSALLAEAEHWVREQNC